MSRLLADYKAKLSRVPAPTPSVAGTGATQVGGEAPQSHNPTQPATEPAAPTSGNAPVYNEALLHQVNADFLELMARYPRVPEGQEDPGNQEKGEFWEKCKAMGFEFDTSTGLFAPRAVTA